MHVPLFSTWPTWLQYAVMIPHGLLASFAMWLWWPKTDEGWRKFGFVAAYLLLYALVMHYVFKAF